MNSGESFDIFRSTELELFASADEIPNWSTAHRARIVLAHVLFEVSEGGRLPKGEVLDLSNGDVETVRRCATWHLGIVGFRAVGSAECLIACGHIPEAGTPARRLVEAAMRARAIEDDPSGNQARAWLMGRPVVSSARLMHRYAGRRFGSVYFNTAHADVGGLDHLYRGAEGLTLNAAPDRDEKADQFAGALLNLIASGVLTLVARLVRAFEPSLSQSTWEEIQDLEVKLGMTETAFVSPDSNLM